MRILTGISLTLTTTASLWAQAECTDVATHTVRLVESAPGVMIEALDWGGDGPRLVFLAGLGNTGHIFDDLAVQFSPEYRVVAITRRGFGASSRPDEGYDADTRARDIIAVLDELGIGQASFAGHSIAGDELSKLGAEHGDRVSKLIYLDAFGYGPEVVGTFPSPAEVVPSPPQSTRDSISVLHRQASQVMNWGIKFPLSELCVPAPAEGVGRKIVQGTHTVAFERITAPTLGLFATARTIEASYPEYNTYTTEQRQAIRDYMRAGSEWRLKQFNNFDSRMPDSELVTIEGAHHYVFLSHEKEVVERMLEFLGR